MEMSGRKSSDSALKELWQQQGGAGGLGGALLHPSVGAKDDDHDQVHKASAHTTHEQIKQGGRGRIAKFT